MKPLFRLILWLSLLIPGAPGNFTASAALHCAGEMPAHIAGRHEGVNGYRLSPQHQDAHFRYASEGGKAELFATESEDDCASQIQFKKYNPVVFDDYSVALYGRYSGYIRHLRTRLPGEAHTYHTSVQRYIALCVIRI